MRTYRTVDEVVTAIQRGFVGHSFVDCYGNVVERVSETDVLLNEGYNHSMQVVTYLASVRDGVGYGRYALPECKPFNPFAWA